MNSPIKAALSWFTRKFQEIVGDLPKDIQTEINNDVAPQQAVNNSFKKQGIFGKLRQRVTEVIEKAAGIGLGQKPKPMPELHTAWDASKMRLSEKLHGTDAKMRAAIVDTIREQLKLGKHAKDAALALYDGYNSGKHVVRQQQLPVYMQKIVNLARRGELTDDEKAALQRLIRRAEQQTAKMGAKGAPNKALKTAYNELLRAVEKGAGKALERGIKVAVEEKSRYVAERIARTEAARAWAEAFHARYKDDDEVLAYKWQLGSRHPNFDICDMYAEANLYGLGKGIFPKDKCPTLPAHPHCLCHLTPIYKDETDLNGQRDRVKQGGDAWLAGLTHAERCKILGIDGAKAWESGAGDWRESMRGYSPEMLGTRIELTRKKKNSQGKHQVIDELIYDNMTRDFLKNGGIIIRGEEAERHLKEAKATASYFMGANCAYIRDNATVSDVLEEMYHAKQDRKNMFVEFEGDVRHLKIEIDAQKYLLKISKQYKIPNEEIEVTKGNLAQYEEKLAELERLGDNDKE